MSNDKFRHEGVLKNVVSTLSGCCENDTNSQESGKCLPLPSQSIIAEIIDISRSVLFPYVFGNDELSASEYLVGIKCVRLLSLLEQEIQKEPSRHFSKEEARDAALCMVGKLPRLREMLNADVLATYNGDPAAESETEVICCYPGIRAICNYRIAHELYCLGARLIARVICEMSHSETGIDIHPAATIGERFSIDHGTGVVIGATAVIGNDVKIYQGVTLGAKSFDLDENNNPVKGVPRHPVLGNGVIVYSNASILGRVNIGDNAVIGGNIWVDEDVAPGERLIQARPDNILRIPPKNNE